MDRVIMHVDLNSFYASVEENRRPYIKGKPIVICVFSGRTEDSGAVSTANYKARELGIKAGIPIKMAKRKAEGKDVVFLPYDIEYYREVSERIMDILEDYSDRIEQASIDEAYLDVSERCSRDWEKASGIAMEIKKEIKGKENLTCSIGIGPNKFVAKMASEFKKPDGLTIVRHDQVQDFLKDMPVEELHGIGDKTVAILSRFGIKKAKDLAGFDLGILEQKFGRNKALLLKNKAMGMDDSPVEWKEKKQISRMGTLKEDSDDIDYVFDKVKELAMDLDKRIRKKNVTYRTITIITIDTSLQMQTRSETMEETQDMELSLPVARSLLEKFFNENPGTKLRRVGIRVSNLTYIDGEQRRGQKSLGEFGK